MAHRISIVQPGPPSPSETFLAAQASRLPAEVSLIYRKRSRRFFVDRSPISRGWRLGHELLTGRSWLRKTKKMLRRELKESQPDVVLAQYGPNGVAVLDLCRELRRPLVVHFHGYDASSATLLRRYARAYQRMFAKAARIIAVSRAMERALRELGAPEETVRYNPYGIDCETFAGASPAGTPPVFLAVGRLTPKKAPHLTIQAFTQVLRDHPGATLRMIGEGEVEDECKTLVQSLGIADKVAFLGAQPHQVVWDEMKRARCFVQHSVVAPSGDSEGTPVAILEAGASGLPVVSTRHAGIPDVVIENTTGFLVDEGDVDAMAEHMRQMAANPELAARIGEAAREHVVANFSMEKHIHRLNAILEEAIAC